MTYNIWPVIKKVTGYDEKRSAGPVFDEGMAIMDKMDKDDLFTKSVIFGMNYGFDRIKKPLKDLAEVRKKVQGNRKLQRGSKDASVLWSAYNTAAAALSPIVEADDIGFRYPVLSHVLGAKRKAEALTSTEHQLYFPALGSLAAESLKLISEIEKSVRSVLDVASVNASRAAGEIISALGQWSDVYMLDAVERGEVIEKAPAIDLLTRAVGIAEGWASLDSGVSDKNPIATSGIPEEYNAATDQLAILI